MISPEFLKTSYVPVSFPLTTAKADDQFALAKAQTQISKMTQQVQTEANAAQAIDEQSLTIARLDVAGAQQKMNAAGSDAATMVQDAKTLETKFAAAVTAKVQSGKTQHETEWQTAFNQTMAAVLKQKYDNSWTGATLNAVGYVWNVYVGYLEGGLQGTLNLLVVVGNTGVGLANLAILTSPAYWGAKAFGVNLTTIPSIPSARGLIVTESDWEYNTSWWLQQGGVALVTLKLPLGAGAATDSSIGNLGAAAKAIPRLLTSEEVAPIVKLLDQQGIVVDFAYGGFKNSFNWVRQGINIVTELAETKAGVFYEEVQHALDFLADKVQFLKDMESINTAANPNAANLLYHVGVFERIATNPLFGLTEEESNAILQAAQRLWHLAQ